MGDRAKGQVKDVLLNEGGTGLADVSGTSDARVWKDAGAGLPREHDGL